MRQGQTAEEKMHYNIEMKKSREKKKTSHETRSE